MSFLILNFFCIGLAIRKKNLSFGVEMWRVSLKYINTFQFWLELDKVIDILQEDHAFLHASKA
jgi:hypothetical protein